MIEIDILNCSSRKKKYLYKEAAKYFIQSLMPKIKNISIDICLENNLDADAFCTQIEPRYFVIEVSRRMPFEEQLKSIAHEMVHCRQFFKKKLQYKNNEILWFGEVYRFNQLKRNEMSLSEYDKYLNMPWEKEAYELETKLYRNFLMQHVGGVE